MTTRSNPRASLEQAVAFAEEHGYHARENNMIDINDTIAVDLTGYGELIELSYRPTRTGYLAFNYGFLHYEIGGRRIGTWKETQAVLVAVQEVWEELHRRGAPQRQPPDPRRKPHGPVLRWPRDIEEEREHFDSVEDYREGGDWGS